MLQSVGAQRLRHNLETGHQHPKILFLLFSGPLVFLKLRVQFSFSVFFSVLSNLIVICSVCFFFFSQFGVNKYH